MSFWEYCKSKPYYWLNWGIANALWGLLVDSWINQLGAVVFLVVAYLWWPDEEPVDWDFSSNAKIPAPREGE